MRLHKRSLLRAFAAGIALCVAFGTAACSGGSTSQENDASADSETPTEQITPIEVVASVKSMGFSCRADRWRPCEGHVGSLFNRCQCA